MGAHALVGLGAVVIVPVEDGRGASAASASAYIEIAPITSTSQALGISFSPIMLIDRQVAQPKLSCKLAPALDRARVAVVVVSICPPQRPLRLPDDVLALM